MKINEIITATNIAEDLDEQDLLSIGDQVVCGYENDLATRKPWEEDLKRWTELALQISQAKSYPWPNAANIKFPLVATAAMQFAARAYPTLVPSDGKLVKCRVVGQDPDGQKTARAQRVSTHMSYQILEQMDAWEEDMDKLLLSLPISGTCFKKTYWDASKKQNCSHLVLPKTLVVNYYAKSLDSAERISEILYLTKRQIKERQLKGIFLDVELGDPVIENLDKESTTITNAFQHDPSEDETTPYTIIEQHTFLDLDDDDYSEPYVVTVDLNSKKVLRIVPRFLEEDIELTEDGKISCINPIQYYTKYDFIPNPDGGFYSLGFGRLLGPLNDSANTLINQLVDAGSMSNLQAGFIGKGLRIKVGDSRFGPGEWKTVNATGDDIKKQIFPLPTREPSEVLFKLLDLLLRSGKELASIAEIFVGKMPGQNTPATTTMATIEQGMKVFTAVYKRVYRSLALELRKIYKLNKTYMNPEEYVDVLDEPVQQADYRGNENDIVPSADPTAVSSQEKQAKAQALLQILQLGTINPMAVTQLYLEAHDVPNAQSFLIQPQPKPDPKMQELELKARIEQEKAQRDSMLAEHKVRLETASKQQELDIKRQMAEIDASGKAQDAFFKQQSNAQALQQNDQSHIQKMVQQDQSHQQKLVHTKQQQNMKPKKESKK